MAVFRSPLISIKKFLDDFDIFPISKHVSDINLIVEDININILLKRNSYVNSYLSLLATHGFSPMYQETTRRPGSGSCIDHVFLRKKTKTDHLPILINMHYKNIFDILLSSNNYFLHLLISKIKKIRRPFGIGKQSAERGKYKLTHFQN